MTFLDEPAASDAQQGLYDEDMQDDGYVWDVTRLWGHQPALYRQLIDLWTAAADDAGLTLREKAMLVLGQATTIGDSYCSFAWSRWVSESDDAALALAALQRDEAPFDERERALGEWARRVAGDANGVSPGDVDRLRDAGFDDPQILALTLYTSLRMAVSTTNDALGARPDLALADTLEPEVRAAITWGRRPA